MYVGAAFLSKKGQPQVFCSVTFVTPFICLSVPECLKRGNRILNHEEIEVVTKVPHGTSPTSHNISSLIGDEENLLISRFAIITLAQVPQQYQNFYYSHLPTPSDFEGLQDNKKLMVLGFMKGYYYTLATSPVTFLSSCDNYMEFLPHNRDCQRGMWLGAGIYNEDRVIAICFEEGLFGVDNNGELEVFCRRIDTVLKGKLLGYLPDKVQLRISPTSYPEQQEGDEASASS